MSIVHAGHPLGTGIGASPWIQLVMGKPGEGMSFGPSRTPRAPRLHSSSLLCGLMRRIGEPSTPSVQEEKGPVASDLFAHFTD